MNPPQKAPTIPNFGETPIPKSNASWSAAELIRKAIIDGEFAEGQRLKESELADALGLSRTPIREALLILQSDGMIANEPRKGAVVRTYRESELADMFDLRAHLEAFAARWACSRRTDEDLADLDASIKALDAIDVDDAGVAEIWRENVRFHMGVAVAAHTPKLVGFLRGLFDLPVYYFKPKDYTVAQKESFVRTHRKIFDAIEARDSVGAEALVRAHVLEARGLRVEHGQSLVAENGEIG
jgi:DNA-binding GntR family transcriptional regulator